IAELADWNYRPDRGLATDLLPTYRDLVERALDACTVSCWNVWGLTGYDGNPFAVDDALSFQRAGVASVYTEFGFTREVRGDTQERYAGDRAAAVQQGVPESWIDLDGRVLPRGYSVLELFDQVGVAGIAPWGSPARTPEAELDSDTGRGITFVPDESPLW